MRRTADLCYHKAGFIPVRIAGTSIKGDDMSSNYSWSKTILSLFITGTFAVLTACGSPSSPAADAAGKTPSSKTKTTPSDKEADNTAENKGDQLVANFNFKEWDNLTPRRWTAEPADKVIKTSGAGPNSVHVEMQPSGADKYTMLRQYLSGNLAGKKITLTLRAKSSEPKTLSAKLNFETASGTQTIALDAGGRGGWESVSRTVSIPADAKADSDMLTIVLRPTAKKSALVDYVMITAE